MIWNVFLRQGRVHLGVVDGDTWREAAAAAYKRWPEHDVKPVRRMMNKRKREGKLLIQEKPSEE